MGGVEGRGEKEIDNKVVYVNPEGVRVEEMEDVSWACVKK